MFVASGAYALNVTGQQSYKGKVSSVAVGFFGHVGISLSDGNTCNGSSVVVLKNEPNSLFKEKLSLLYAAIATKAEVEIYQPADSNKLIDFGGTDYCTVSEISYSDFPLW